MIVDDPSIIILGHDCRSLSVFFWKLLLITHPYFYVRRLLITHSSFFMKWLLISHPSLHVSRLLITHVFFFGKWQLITHPSFHVTILLITNWLMVDLSLFILLKDVDEPRIFPWDTLVDHNSSFFRKWLLMIPPIFTWDKIVDLLLFLLWEMTVDEPPIFLWTWLLITYSPSIGSWILMTHTSVLGTKLLIILLSRFSHLELRVKTPTLYISFTEAFIKEMGPAA